MSSKRNFEVPLVAARLVVVAVAVLLSSGPLRANEIHIVPGVSSLWSFDRATGVVTVQVESIQPREVAVPTYPGCWDAPLRFLLRNDEQVVLSEDICWEPMAPDGGRGVHGSHLGVALHFGAAGPLLLDNTTALLHFAVDIRTINNYEVIYLETGTRLGAGPMVWTGEGAPYEDQPVEKEGAELEVER